MGGGPAQGADISAEVVRRVSEVENSVEVAAGSGVFVELGGVPVQAASMGGITEPGLVGGKGVACHRGPEGCLGELAFAVSPAVLIQVIREPVQRHARDTGRAVSQLLTVVPGAGSGCAGAGPARSDRARAGRPVPGCITMQDGGA